MCYHFIFILTLFGNGPTFFITHWENFVSQIGTEKHKFIIIKIQVLPHLEH